MWLRRELLLLRRERGFKTLLMEVRSREPSALSGVTVAEITFFAIVQSFMLYVTDKL